MSDEDRVEEPTILEETEGLSGQDGPNLSAGDASRTSEGDVHEKEITSVVGDPPQDADHVGDIPADTGRLEQSEQDIEPEASSDFVANDQNVHTPEGGDVVETGGHPEDEIRSELRPISDPADAASGPAGEAGEGGNATQVEELETADQSDEVDEDFFEPDVISVEDVSGDEEEPPIEVSPKKPHRSVAVNEIDLSKGPRVLLDDELGAVLIDDVDELVEQLRKTSVRRPQSAAQGTTLAVTSGPHPASTSVSGTRTPSGRSRKQWDIPSDGAAHPLATHGGREGSQPPTQAQSASQQWAPFSTPSVPPPHLVPTNQVARSAASLPPANRPISASALGGRRSFNADDLSAAAKPVFAGSQSATSVRDRIVASSQREAGLRAEAEVQAFDLEVYKHENEELRCRVGALTKLIEQLREELESVSAELDAERAHPAYSRSLALEQQVRELRVQKASLEEELREAWGAAEGEREAVRDARAEIRAQRDEIGRLRNALERAVAEGAAAREGAVEESGRAVRELQEQVAALQGALEQAELNNRMLSRRALPRPDSAPMSGHPPAEAAKAEANRRLRAIESSLQAMANVAEIRSRQGRAPQAFDSAQAGQGPTGRPGAQRESGATLPVGPASLPRGGPAPGAPVPDRGVRTPMPDPSVLEPAGIPGYAFHPEYGIVPIVESGPRPSSQGGRLPSRGHSGATARSAHPDVSQPGRDPGADGWPHPAHGSWGSGAPVHVHIHQGAEGAGGRVSAGEWAAARGGPQGRAASLHEAARPASGYERAAVARGEASLRSMGREAQEWRGEAGKALRGGEPERGAREGRGGIAGPPNDGAWGADGVGAVAEGQERGPGEAVAGARGREAFLGPSGMPRSVLQWSGEAAGAGLARKRQKRGADDVAVPPEKVREEELEAARREYVSEVQRIKEMRMREAMQEAGRV